MRSIYRWEGKVQDDVEALLILKTERRRFDALRARVLQLHPYQVPEVVALPVEAGSDPRTAAARSGWMENFYGKMEFS